MAQRDQGMRMLINDEEDEEDDDDDDDDPLPAGNLLSGGGARGDQTGIEPWPAGGGYTGIIGSMWLFPFWIFLAFIQWKILRFILMKGNKSMTWVFHLIH